MTSFRGLDELLLIKVKNILFIFVLLTSFEKGFAILCYECRSTQNPDCGPLFKKGNFNPTECLPDHDVCALQRQSAIQKVKQVAAISRGCYKRGSLIGLNNSDGCRLWTNDVNYTALYCFCSTDLCNRASPSTVVMIERLSFLSSPAVLAAFLALRMNL